MGTHAGDARLCFAACLVLSVLARTEQNEGAHAVLAASGLRLQAIVAALEKHSGDSDVCFMACEALGNLAGSAEGADAVVAAGAAPSITAALVKHVGNGHVRSAACDAVGSIAFYAAPCGVAALLAAGAVPALAAALLKHPGDKGLDKMVHALAYIAFNNEGRAAVVAVGAVPLIVAALVTHAGDEVVCIAANGALSKIAGSAEGRAAVIAAGALAAIVAALVTHAGEANVCRVACFALRCIAHSAEDGIPAVLAVGAAVPAITAALVQHSGDEDVCGAACDALGNIAGSAEGRATVEAAGAADVLLAMHAAEHPAAGAARAALQRIRPPLPSTLLLLPLPPPQVAARFASCLECWRATPRAACTHGGARDPCPICQGEYSLPGAPWTALRCGHLLHGRCMMKWAAWETRGARAEVALPSFTAAHCPVCRCEATGVVLQGEAAPADALPVGTPPSSPADTPPGSPVAQPAAATGDA